jgi:hypothetical protein
VELGQALVVFALIAALSVTGSWALSGRAATKASASRPKYCPTKKHVLDGVYHPERLRILKLCQRATGVVTKVILEGDGDLHIRFLLNSNYTPLTNDVNDAKQNGDLVVEFMPRDGGHLPKPRKNDELTLVGAWVTDLEHGCAACTADGWNELHPIWRLIRNGTVYTSGPKNGGSPPQDRSANSEADCRDHGQPCTGYRHP